MASFDKRISPVTGKISWRVRIRRRGFPTLVNTFLRKTDAKLWAEETEAALSSGQYLSSQEAKKHRVKDVLEIYESEILDRLKDPHSRLYHLKAWRPELEYITLADLQPHHIRNFREKLMKNPNVTTTVKQLQLQADNAAVETRVATQHEVLQTLTRYMHNAKTGDSASVRAAELLGKHYGLFTEKEQNKPKPKSSEQIKEELKKLLLRVGTEKENTPDQG
jgi:hypothetical protein